MPIARTLMPLLLAGAASATAAQPPAPPATTTPTTTAETTAATPAPPAPAVAQAGDGVDEIVVTAQRRSQSLLSVPLSITAAAGDALKDQGLRDVASLQTRIPGLSLSNGAGYTQLYIRGVGNSIFVGADPSVATFIDDVPRIYGSLVNTFVNVERVEVLKGAQGGLYGRNATGGVVNIVTRQPAGELAGDVRVSVGSHDTIEAAAYVNVPITDAIEWNLSAQRNYHHPYVTNQQTSRTPYSAANFPTGSYLGTPAQTAAFFNSSADPQGGYGRQDLGVIDSKLRFHGGERFTLTLAGDYARKKDDIGIQIFQTAPAVLRQTIVGLFQAFGINASLPADFFRGPTKKFATYKGNDGYSNLRDYGGSATAVLKLDGVDLTSITAYRVQDTDYLDDLGTATVSTLTAGVYNRKHYFYQELRAVSTGTGPLSFLGGATYLRSRLANLTQTAFLPPLFTQPPTASVDHVRNWSVYAQAGYDILPALNLTVSGRYIHESNDARFSRPAVATTGIDASKFLPSATLSYKLAGGGTAYARWARGFKAGGVNPVVPPTQFPSNFGSTFGPEQVDTYEVGLRAPLIGNKVQFTSAVFYNDYKGLQAVTNGNAANPQIVEAIINAGTARSYGAEAGVTWRAARPLTLGVTGGYLNARYRRFSNTDGTVFSTFDFDGKRMIQSPKWQLALTADLDQPITPGLHLVGNALGAYASRITFFNATYPGTVDPAQPGYWLANLRLGVRTADKRFELAGFVRNLFNKGYVTFGSSSATGNVLGWGDPRIIGAEAHMRF